MNEVKTTSEKLKILFPFFNFGVILLLNILIFWTWINIFYPTDSEESEPMFFLAFMIPLFILTIYYPILLIRSIILLKKRSDLSQKMLSKHFTLFCMAWLPLVWIFLTSLLI